MKPLIVSSHFPPNFVSGGALQPQRLAHGLRARGHDVTVFAGWHGNRAALDEWDEADSTGLPVHWIVPPTAAWADPLSWDNPEVTERFARHLHLIEPDVVHLHSLQSLGAGVVSAARDAGLPVVVTMHDFWWSCGRQFLADPDLRPCSLVVDAGACGCEVDEAWRRARSDTLRALLDGVDLILTPSPSAARILRANGLDGGRLVVDENGMPDDIVERASHRRSPTPQVGDTLRFLYAGGGHPLKGPGVVVEAAQRLATTSGWSLTAYGLADYLHDARRSVDGLPVVVEAMFDPTELDDVLARHDVLMLPSVMLETYSLLTREALAAGLAVICTDNPGPTEVVRHHVNGLVVPLADAAALAEAMRRLVTDRPLLEQLRTGAAERISLRRLDDQVTALEEHFGDLVAATRRGSTPGSRARPRIGHVVFAVGINGAPLRYRARLPAEALRLHGVDSEVVFYRDPRLRAACERADAVVMYRVPATTEVLQVIEAARTRGVPVVFDVDDLIVDPELAEGLPSLERLPAEDRLGFIAGVSRYRTTLEACDGFIGSTAALVEEVGALTGLPTWLFENGVGLEIGRVSDLELRRARRPGPPRIGFLSGTITHAIDWEYIEPAVVAVMEQRPAVELWLGGHVVPTRALKRFESRVVRLPFKRWDQLPAVLRDLDINLAPLATSARFDAAKSAVKWLEAALCETPTVASPTAPFRRVIVPNVTGMLADTPEDWVAALLELVDDDLGRARIGATARREALLTLSPWTQGERYLDILHQASSLSPRTSTSSWSPVVVDEPALDIVLDPYPHHARQGAATATRRERMRRFVRRLVRVVRRDGVVATGSRAVTLLVDRVRSRRRWTT